MGLRNVAAAIATAVILPACGGIVDPSKNTVTPYSGTFDVGGVGPVIPFSASKNGEFFITLTALSPDSTAIVAAVYGQPVSNGCAQFSNNVATVGRQFFGGQIDKGNYCVQLYDAGLQTLSGPQTYSIRVSVP